MIKTFSKAWSGFIGPILQRPKRLQVAALCYSDTGDQKKVLLVTSRGTGRWIIPKGWPIKGKDAAGAALQEAWEEAGVKTGTIGKAIGKFDYDKELSTGLPVPVETLVFPVKVSELRDDYPEADERTRKWVSPQKAANMVREAGLQDILKQL